MIALQFIYKGTVVAVRKFALDYNEENNRMIRDRIKHGLIPMPENYERYELVANESENLWRG